MLRPGQSGAAADGAGDARESDRGAEDRTRQEHVSRAQGPDGRRPRLRLRHPLPVPGPRSRSGDPGLNPAAEPDHPDQPRRRLGAPRHPHGLARLAGRAGQGIDGSTWDPWAKRLLFTTENANAPTYAGTASFPMSVTDVSGALGRGGYEGIQDDSDGNIWIVEDIGGPNKPGTTAKQPNSFVYRYVPKSPGDLQNGKLQVLQVLNGAGQPVTFESQAASTLPIRLYWHHGASFTTHWLTIRQESGTSVLRTLARLHAHRSSDRRTASSGPARSSRSSTSTRPGTPTQRARRTAIRRPAPAAQAGGRRSSSSSRSRAPRPTAASSRSSTRGTSRSPVSTMLRSSRGTS